MDSSSKSNFTVDAIEEAPFSKICPYFVMSKKGINKLFLYNSYYKFFERSIEAFHNIQTLTYLKGTDFIVVSSSDQINAFLRLHNQHLAISHRIAANSISNVSLVPFDFKHGMKGASTPTNLLSNPSLMYLWMYVSQGTLIVQPPKICWSECKTCPRNPLFYGGIKYCEECRSTLERKILRDFKTAESTSVCHPRSFDCTAPDLGHLPQLFDLAGNPKPEGRQRTPFCYKYEISAQENFNSLPNSMDLCSHGYMKNEYGVCMPCNSAEKPLCDLCFHFVDTGSNCQYLNLQNYTWSSLEVKQKFKRSTKEVNYRDYKKTYFLDENQIVKPFVKGPFEALIPYAQEKRLQDCAKYNLIGSALEFDLEGRRGFLVEFQRKDIVDFNSEIQYNYTCFMRCSQGFY